MEFLNQFMKTKEFKVCQIPVAVRLLKKFAQEKTEEKRLEDLNKILKNLKRRNVDEQVYYITYYHYTMKNWVSSEINDLMGFKLFPSKEVKLKRIILDYYSPYQLYSMSNGYLYKTDPWYKYYKDYIELADDLFRIHRFESFGNNSVTIKISENDYYKIMNAFELEYVNG